MARRRKKIKLAVGDRYVADSGRSFEITSIDPEAFTITVQVERRVITRDGEITSDTRERTVPKELWNSFSRLYRKEKA